MGSRRLAGMELFCDRAGESAAFYAWLLSSDAESGSDEWEPIHLLADRGVTSVRRAETGGPGPMWIPAMLVADVDETCERMKAQGGSCQYVDSRSYVIDADGVWTRVVAADAIPFGMDTEVLKSTVLDYITLDAARVAAAYRTVLDLEGVEFVDDPHDYRLLTDSQHIAMGVANYATAAQSPVPHPSWMLYFDVPDVTESTDRAVRAGARVVIPQVEEDYNTWSVLVDPYGVTFGLSQYHDFTQSQITVRLDSGDIVPLSAAARLG